MSVQPCLRGSNELRVGRKMAKFQLFFQSREQVVGRRGQIRRIGWVIKTLEAQVGQFLLGCKCPVTRSVVVQEQDTLGYLLAAFLLQNVLHLDQQRWVILRVYSLVLFLHYFRNRDSNSVQNFQMWPSNSATTANSVRISRVGFKVGSIFVCRLLGLRLAALEQNR